MANLLHRTSKQYLVSVDPNGLPEPIANYIDNPNLSAITGFASKYWIITGDVVTLMDAAARAVVDAAELQTQRDSTTAQLDQVENVLRAFMLTVLDELNQRALKVNEMLDAIDAGTNLASVKANILAVNDFPQRTVVQLRNEVRGKLGN